MERYVSRYMTKYITVLSLLFSMLVGCAPNGSHDPDSQGMQEILQKVRDEQLPISGLTVAQARVRK